MKCFSAHRGRKEWLLHLSETFLNVEELVPAYATPTLGVGVNRSADTGAGEAGRGGLQSFVVSHQLLHSLAELQCL